MSSEFIGFPEIETKDGEYTTNFMICTDPIRLQQVLLNLFSNALKFTQKGGYVKIISQFLPSKGDHGSILIKVEDSGIGIKQ